MFSPSAACPENGSTTTRVGRLPAGDSTSVRTASATSCGLGTLSPENICSKLLPIISTAFANGP
ncbi:hypothetical protein [Polyangium sp. 15x6]|uniref:hypothetical protein n=1 Tax=Polyangium sp. 15x6 TaxID=3042687 RepID=UPI00249A8692|nr:hypothetical protein [Polyangium sp. 15x6]MDI3281680.1 hypothetical protein [Polyangium sp. 15x6]